MAEPVTPPGDELLADAWTFVSLLVAAGHAPSAELEQWIVDRERSLAWLWSWSWE
jgi:hypothetical protein